MTTTADKLSTVADNSNKIKLDLKGGEMICLNSVNLISGNY